MLSKQQIPNLLTFARVAAVPICLAIMLVAPERSDLLLWIFILASITDYLDGYLARKWNVVSPLGTMLDPVADKLLVALILIYLLTAMGSGLLLPVCLIILRELYIAGLREFLATRQIALPVSKGGKWKTALQMIAITLLLASISLDGIRDAALTEFSECGTSDALTTCESTPVDAIVGIIQLSGMAMLYCSALLALTSAFSYTRAALRQTRP